ncbi:hypothetical protein GGD61_008102 [Bradyrhizobium sp. SBR1B]|nr:hypothetical protein [Bradyrhizobium sp. SBR1B]
MPSCQNPIDKSQFALIENEPSPQRPVAIPLHHEESRPYALPPRGSEPRRCRAHSVVGERRRTHAGCLRHGRPLRSSSGAPRVDESVASSSSRRAQVVRSCRSKTRRCLGGPVQEARACNPAKSQELPLVCEFEKCRSRELPVPRLIRFRMQPYQLSDCLRMDRSASYQQPGFSHPPATNPEFRATLGNLTPQILQVLTVPTPPRVRAVREKKFHYTRRRRPSDHREEVLVYVRLGSWDFFRKQLKGIDI